MVLTNCIEIVGSALILSSIFMRLFIVNQLTQLEENIKSYKLENKINQLWTVLSQLYRKHYPEESGIFSAVTNIKGMDESWDYGEEKTKLEKRNKRFRFSTNSFFILGSSLVLTAKIIHAITASKPI